MKLVKMRFIVTVVQDPEYETILRVTASLLDPRDEAMLSCPTDEYCCAMQMADLVCCPRPMNHSENGV